MKKEILILVSVAGLVFSMFVFMSGWHNVDLAYNMKTMEYTYNKTYIDIVSQEQELTADQLYLTGTDYMLWSALGLVVFGLFVGYLSRKITITSHARRSETSICCFICSAAFRFLAGLSNFPRELLLESPYQQTDPQLAF